MPEAAVDADGDAESLIEVVSCPEVEAAADVDVERRTLDVS